MPVLTPARKHLLSLKNGGRSHARLKNGVSDQVDLMSFRANAISRSIFLHERLKRNFDFVLSGLLILTLSPLFTFISLLIMIDSFGSPIYKQRRRGRHGIPFWIYKFRTMHNDVHKLRGEMFSMNEADGILFKMKNDPRMTRVGRWLRRFSIDELPQLLNVFKGEMSLVGPRPFSVEVFRRVKISNGDYRRWFIERHGVSPGMTGMWQVSGRNDVSFKDLMRLDLEYVKNWSIFLDAIILLRTVRVVFGGKGAY